MKSNIKAVLKAVKICGSQAALAEKLGVTQGFISQLARGERPVPATLCRGIELATDGKVTREQLRRDVFGAPKRRAKTKAAA